ncbi:MAG: hypothetical protein R6X18_17580 [Chloroflexota bacterium]|jgi:hypothetical protein
MSEQNRKRPEPAGGHLNLTETKPVAAEPKKPTRPASETETGKQTTGTSGSTVAGGWRWTDRWVI